MAYGWVEFGEEVELVGVDFFEQIRVETFCQKRFIYHDSRWAKEEALTWFGEANRSTDSILYSSYIYQITEFRMSRKISQTNHFFQ